MDYWTRRVEQERNAARRARDSRARRCHEQLALLHSAAVSQPPESVNEPDEQQQIRAAADFIVLR